jgi:hypothetical protein
LSKKTLILCLFLTGMLALTQLALAVEVVRVDKTKIRLSIPPGKTKVGSISVENPTDEPKTVKVYLNDWEYVAPFDGAKQFKPIDSTMYSCSDWITYSPSEVYLGPYGKAKINYTVKVPEGASGGHYSLMFFESMLGKPDSQGVGVSVAVRIATLFYIEAEGAIKKEAAFSNFSLERKSKEKLLNMSLDMKNTGNLDITASGDFNIIDKKGMVFGRGSFNTVYTFPGDMAKLTGSWSLPIPKGVYDLVLTLNLGKAQEELNLGRGEVIVKEAEIEFDENGQAIKIGELK